MASANPNKEENEQWKTIQDPHDPHQWSDSSDDENDHLEDPEFFDAKDDICNPSQSPSTENKAEADLLHNRLNAQLSTDEKKPKKSPG